MVRKVSLTFFVLVSSLTCFSQNRQRWVDSVYRTLSNDAKIGQLLILRASPSSEDDFDRITDNIESYHIGGVVITRTDPVRHSQFVNETQKKSAVPLLFGIEAVQGPGYSMDGIAPIPPPLVLSALRSDSLIAAAAKELAREMKLLQLNINFLPLANVNINGSSYPDKLLHFGSPSGYLRTAEAFMKEMTDAGIITCAQHELRLNNSNETSELVHHGIPDTSLFTPYRQLISRGLPAVMTTRLPYFYVEQNKNLPVKLSQLFVSENIRRGLGFNGLTFTDIPSLQQVVAKPRGGETETLAFQIGNDLLIDPPNLSQTVKKIRKALKKNTPLQQRLDSTVKKILYAKYDAGLAVRKPIDPDNLMSKLNSTNSKLLIQRIYRECVTLVTNEAGLVPVKGLAGKKFAVVSVGMETENPFAQYLSKYAAFDKYSIRLPEDTAKLADNFEVYDLVVIAAFPMAERLLPEVMPSVSRLAGRSIAAVFGDPAQLGWFTDFGTVVAGYSDAVLAQRSAAEIVFGAIRAKGRLPVTASDQWREGSGSSSELMNRLAYGLPEEVGINSKALESIARIAREAVDSASTPGCHVLVARKGKIIFDRSFGWYTYENQTPVNAETIYDLASITKVMATLQSVMYLQERGMIDVNKKASVYLPELATSNKKDITLKDMLTHQSGLLPFIPMWPQTIRDNQPDPYYYSATRDDMYPMQVAPSLFVAPIIGDSAWHWALQSKLLNKAPRTPFAYRYSDMGSMILHRMANRVLGEPMEDFLQRYFYAPIGAVTLGYKPLERFRAEQIAPSEIDTTYRKQLLLGTVNDERAAMLGGVAGHAGLFGNATDLAKMGQMLLNGGTYGGIQFLQPETVELFTNKQYANSHRGLGWDKPITGEWNGSTSELASPRTFGHTGFTGTCIWVDPEFDLVYVFLSNRVFPGRSTKLLRTNVRTRIQSTIYRSIFDYCQYEE